MIDIKGTWPKEVPVLNKENICKGDYQKGCRRCIAGWLYSVFGESDCDLAGADEGSSTQVTEKVLDTITKHAKICLTKKGYHDSRIADGLAYGFNDLQDITREDIAQVWNDSIMELGYTEQEYI